MPESAFVAGWYAAALLTSCLWRCDLKVFVLLWKWLVEFCPFVLYGFWLVFGGSIVDLVNIVFLAS